MDFGDAVRGAASATTTAATTLIAAPSTDQSLYVGAAQFGNTSASAATVTLNDTAATVLVVPAGSAISVVFAPPLKVPIGTALTFKVGANTTTLYASAQGWAQDG